MSEPLSVEEVQTLGEHIAEQAVHLDAAMHRLLADLRTFDAAGGWYRQGFGTCAHWLSWRVGWDLGTAREHLRVARALHTLPLVSEALSAGQISYSKTRAITRVATAAEAVAGYAQHCTASQLETVCRKVGSWGGRRQPSFAPNDSERHVAHTTTALGMVCVKACLRPDEAAPLLQVLQQAAVGLHARASGRSAEVADVSAEASAPAERSTDVSAETRSTTTTRRPYNRADGLMALVHTYARGSSAERSPVELIVTVPVAVLQQSAATADSATADSATDISATTDVAIDPASFTDRGASPPGRHRRDRPLRSLREAPAVWLATAAWLSPHSQRRRQHRRAPLLHRPQDPHYPRRPRALLAARPHLPVPWLRSPPVPRESPPAHWGRRRRDQAPNLALLCSLHHFVCSRARLSHHAVCHWRA
ncbi:MAG: hypothetical protein IPI49_33385, partial [Myxococcales bacterium]|nr:hypothetical protein [Myxococcales bacterium]